MSLRLVNKQKLYPVTACDTVFRIVSLSLGEKEKLISGLVNIGTDDGAFSRLVDLITDGVIISIDGYDESPKEVISKLEDLSQLRSIITAVIEHCSMMDKEVKNSDSSLEPPTPASAGNVEKTA